MPWSGGVFSRTNGTYNGATTWAQDAAAAIGITTGHHDTHDQDLATGINSTLCKDGSNTPTANLPMNNFKHTGVAAASGTGQYMRYDEVTAGYQPLDATLTALAGLTTANNQIILATGTDTFSMISCTSQGQTLISKSNYPAMKGLLELSQNVTASGASLSIDLSLGWNIELTLSANVTSVAFTNVPASGSLCRVTLDIASTGSFTMTGWPGTTRWAGGNAYSATASGKDTVVLTTADGGTTYRGYVSSVNMS